MNRRPIRSVDQFVRALKRRASDERVDNFYRRKHVAANLSCYLDAIFSRPGPRILLVGEAPGYRGAVHTGIPFSSGLLYEDVDHPLLKALRPQLTIRKYVSENTASIVWRYLCTTDVVPLFWNAFPYHPYPPGDILANRRPTQAEMREGRDFLAALASLYQPEIVAGVGRVGTEAARRAFPDRKIAALRHPSYGGKREFIGGMDALLKNIGCNGSAENCDRRRAT